MSTAHPHSPVKSGGIHLAADKIILLFRETCSENLFSVVMSVAQPLNGGGEDGLTATTA